MRKHTRFITCEQHKPLFHGMRRERKAEFYVEGGPASAAPCVGDGCRLFPGADLFVPELADGSELTLNWAINAREVAA